MTIEAPKQTDILSKIKKILAKADQENAHEADVAMRMAQRLMLEHNFTMQDVDGLEEPDPYIVDRVDEGKCRLTDEAHYANKIISAFFNVVVSYRRGWYSNAATKGNGERQARRLSYNYYGKTQNVAVAIHVYGFLTAEFNRLWKVYCAEQKKLGLKMSRNTRKSFILGLYRGLESKLSQEQSSFQQETGLVVVRDPALKAYSASLKNMQVAKVTVNREALGSGYAEGRQIQINTAVTSPTKKPALT